GLRDYHCGLRITCAARSSSAVGSGSPSLLSVSRMWTIAGDHFTLKASHLQPNHLMSISRRDFLGSSAVSAAALAALPKTLFASVPSDLVPVAESDEWDLAWPAKLSGKY